MKDEYYETNEERMPQVVDLGLPSGTKWASCNVGASQPWEYGGSYAWGEIEEKEVYNDATYLYFDGEDTDGDGFYDKEEKNEDLGENICGTQYDVAHMKWGGDWQMPTREQFMELVVNCEREWTELHGVKGLKFIGPNGNSIFLPAGGCRSNSGFEDLNDSGCYWSSMVSKFAAFNSDKADELLLKRCAANALCICAPFVDMRHWDEREQAGSYEVDDTDKALLDMVLDIQYRTQHHYFGELARNYFEEQMLDATQFRRRTTRFEQCYQRLPDVFTTEQFSQVFGYANSRSAAKTIDRFLKDKTIERTKRGEYRKRVQNIS